MGAVARIVECKPTAPSATATAQPATASAQPSGAASADGGVARDGALAAGATTSIAKPDLGMYGSDSSASRKDITTTTTTSGSTTTISGSSTAVVAVAPANSASAATTAAAAAPAPANPVAAAAAITTAAARRIRTPSAPIKHYRAGVRDLRVTGGSSGSGNGANIEGGSGGGGAGAGGAGQHSLAVPHAAFFKEQWLYRDPEGRTQGPFAGQDILDWRDAGFFGDELPVRSALSPADAPWVSLGTVFTESSSTSAIDGGCNNGASAAVGVSSNGVPATGSSNDTSAAVGGSSTSNAATTTASSVSASANVSSNNGLPASASSNGIPAASGSSSRTSAVGSSSSISGLLISPTTSIEVVLAGERVCAQCGAVPGNGVRLSRCARCELVRYCSASCQREHWKGGHKAVCVVQQPPQ